MAAMDAENEEELYPGEHAKMEKLQSALNLLKIQVPKTTDIISRELVLSPNQMQEVAKILKAADMQQYLPLFEEHGFDSISKLSQLIEEDLIIMGVQRVHRKVILDHLLRTNITTQVSASSPLPPS